MNCISLPWIPTLIRLCFFCTTKAQLSLSSHFNFLSGCLLNSFKQSFVLFFIKKCYFYAYSSCHSQFLSCHAISTRQIQATALPGKHWDYEKWQQALGHQDTINAIFTDPATHLTCNTQLAPTPQVTLPSNPDFYVLKGQTSLKGAFVFPRGSGWQCFPMAKHRDLSWPALRVHISPDTQYSIFTALWQN